MDDIQKNFTNILNDEDKGKQYDEVAKVYDKVLTTVGYGDPDVVCRAITDLGLPKDSKFMDFCCGTGRMAIALSALGYKNHDGIDASEEMLKIAREKGCYQELEFMYLGMGEIPEKWKKGYDCLTCIASLVPGHIPPD